MGETTKIEWTDHTFNPWWGCAKVHAGCTHCYAESFSNRTGQAKWGPGGSRSVTSDSYWQKPIKWNAQAAADGVRRRVFCASMADVFEDWKGRLTFFKTKDEQGDVVWPWAWFGPKKIGGRIRDGVLTAGQMLMGQAYGKSYRNATLDDLRRRLFALIDATPNLDWLLLTKRPENVRNMIPCRRDTNGDGDCELCSKGRGDCKRRSNVWLGTSVSDQETAEKFAPELLKLRDLSPVLFLSAEPLLGPIDFTKIEAPAVLQSSTNGGLCADALRRTNDERFYNFDAAVDWIIVGGESGPGARPCDVGWVRSIVQQCRAASVPCFAKQLGGYCVAPWNDPAIASYVRHGRPSADSFQLGADFKIQTLAYDESLGLIRLNDRKGGDWTEWPPELGIRQFPKVDGVPA